MTLVDAVINIACFFLGVTLMWMYCQIVTLKIKVEKLMHRPGDGPGTMLARPPHRPWWERVLPTDRSRWYALAIFLFCMGLISSGLSAYTAIQDRQQTRCFRDYNLEVQAWSRARAAAADQDRSSLNKMLFAVGNADFTPAQRRAAFNDYLENLRTTDELRKANPLPDPPNAQDYCT